MDKIQKGLFFFINGLFVAKYSLRLGYNPFVALGLYAACAIVVMYLVLKSNHLPENKAIKIAYLFACISIVAIIALLQSLINPLQLQVDRWSAIHNFLQNLFQGIYPYAAKTHLGGYGSPFPVWQFFHIPFYLLSNVGLGMVFSVIILFIFLIRYFRLYRSALSFLILLIISPAFWYEVAVRSDLIYNFILCLVAIGWIHKQKYTIQKQAYGLGILCGLFLSTRLAVIIPFAVFLLPDFFAASPKQKFIFGLSAAGTFVLTFLPFICWNFNALLFFKYSPFVLQTRQGSVWEVLLLIALTLFLSSRWKGNLKLCCSSIAVILVVFVAQTFVHRMINEHFAYNLFSPAYDITYFTMALPFVLFAIINKPGFQFSNQQKVHPNTES